MTIVQAEQEVRACAEAMRVRYGDKTVFDEWAIVSLANNKGRILGYIGPRKEGFRKNFASDITGLLGGLYSQAHQVGDFEFSRHAVGTGFEAFMVVGEHLYLICNNTEKAMDAIAKDPLWLSAQVPFVELSEKFRADALVD
jgi:hypothetical protein